jgi:hypothetical protein
MSVPQDYQEIDLGVGWLSRAWSMGIGGGGDYVLQFWYRGDRPAHDRVSLNLTEEQALIVLRELIKRFPLDALGRV